MLYNHVKNAWEQAILAYNTAENSKDYDSMAMLLRAIADLSRMLQWLDSPAGRLAEYDKNPRPMTKEEYNKMMEARARIMAEGNKPVRPISDFTVMEALS